MNLTKLHEKFNATDIEWRIQSSGKTSSGKLWAKVLAYVTNRAIMERLDVVCGPENWKNEFKEAPNGGVLCGISIKCGGEWITKWDGAENTQVEAVKGGLSSAMKRAGVQWGIGRYLYSLEVTWANINQNGKHSARTKDNTWFKWDEPILPAWALPKTSKAEAKRILGKEADEIFKLHENKDAHGLKQIVDELTEEEKSIVWGLIPSDIHKGVKQLLSQAVV